MNLWSLDFTTHDIEALDAAGFGAARAAGRFCWLDLAAEDFEALPEPLSTIVPASVAAELRAGPLSELRFDDAWIAFGLSEPVSEEGPVRGANLLFSDGLLITCDFRDSETLRRLRHTWREDFLRFARSPGFLLFELGDHYISVAQNHLHALEDRIENLQRHLFGNADDSVFGDTAEAMRALFDFRRRVVGAQEAFEELSARSSSFIPESTQPFLARCALRLERMANELLLQRDGLVSGLNLYIGMNGHRTGLLLQRLTGFSIIFLPLSFFAGVFGMNFTHFPGIDARYGFEGFWIVCALITLTLLAVARRGRWF